MSATMPRTESVFEEFSDAKRKIQEVFEQIKEQIEAVQTFIEHVVTIDTDHVLSSDTIAELNELVVKVTGVHEILSRDQMKVAFFGRTSNGKSTCINAMLWDKVLPSGIGHTTSCFLAVEGSGKPNPYIITEDGEEQAVEKVQKLAHALSGAAEKLTEDSLIKICWPKNKCRILNAEVCIVDSPGVDVTPDLDLWIDKHCLDADVFILVANAESTMMQAEKNFFHKVSECFSKPNIFILHNRWDASAQEPDMMDEVRAQHMERAEAFLTDELKIYNSAEAQNRVFFISAREMLNTRIARTKGIPENPNNFPDGFKSRQLEFEEFEKKFEECITRSAIATKFSQHVSGGENTVKHLSKMLANLNTSALEIRNIANDEADTQKMRKNFNKEQMEKVTKKVHEQISMITDNVSNQVAAALDIELGKVSELVGNFKFEKFHPSKFVIDAYRKKLIEHVEDGVRQNLVSLCSSSLSEEVNRAKQEMIEGLTNVIKDARKCELEAKHPFSLQYEINFFALNDFKEDLSFKFSASPARILEKVPYLGKAVTSYSVLTFLQNMTVAASTNLPAQIENITNGTVRAADMETLNRFVPSGVVAAAAWKFWTKSGLSTVGNRVIVSAAIAYAGYYAFERIRWTPARQGQEFRKQFAEHASEKLRHSVEYTASKCSDQVSAELKDTFTRLEITARDVTDDLTDEINQLEEKSQHYEGIAEMSKKWKNKFDWLEIELRNYRNDFIPKLPARSSAQKLDM